MDSFGKKEKGLRDIIENQKEQLGRYEKKLRGWLLYMYNHFVWIVISRSDRYMIVLYS